MFHCNGWCFPWTLAAIAGTNVCLRQIDAAAIFRLIREHSVTHYCGAPIVHNTLLNSAPDLPAGITHKVHAMVAAAAPPAATIRGMEDMGFELTHVYGLTETYGPAARLSETARVGCARYRAARRPERQAGLALRARGGHGRARSGDHGAGSVGRPDYRRDHVPRQHHDEGIPEESEGDGRGICRRMVSFRRSRRRASGWLREDSRSREGRDHLGRRRTFRRSKSKMPSTIILPFWPSQWSRSRMRNGARRRARSSSSRLTRRPRRARSSSTADRDSRITRHRRLWSLARCRRRRPGRFRSSSCGIE